MPNQRGYILWTPPHPAAGHLAAGTAVLLVLGLAFVWPRERPVVRSSWTALAFPISAAERQSLHLIQANVHHLVKFAGLRPVQVRVDDHQAEMRIMLVAESDSVVAMRSRLPTVERTITEWAEAGQFYRSRRLSPAHELDRQWQPRYAELRALLRSMEEGSFELARHEESRRQGQGQYTSQECSSPSRIPPEAAGGAVEAPAELVQRKSQLETLLAQLLTTRTELHPEVRQIKDELSHIVNQLPPIYAAHRAVGETPQLASASGAAADNGLSKGPEAVADSGLSSNSPFIGHIQDIGTRLRERLEELDRLVRQWASSDAQEVPVPARLIRQSHEYSCSGGLTVSDWMTIAMAAASMAVLVYLRMQQVERGTVSAASQLVARWGWPVWAIVGRRPGTAYWLCAVWSLTLLAYMLAALVAGGLVWMLIIDPHWVTIVVRDPCWAIGEVLRSAG